MPGLPATIVRRLRLPLIAAPMFAVSGPELVLAACRSGAIGAFPAANRSRPTIGAKGDGQGKVLERELRQRPTPH